MPDYLLDTNHIIHLLNGLESLRQRIQVAEDTQRFSISMTVLGELYYAVYASQRRRGKPSSPTIIFIRHCYLAL